MGIDVVGIDSSIYVGAFEGLAENKKYSLQSRLYLAGETRFEHATYGFGDRYSTVEPLPCVQRVLYRILLFSSRIFSIKSQKRSD